MDCVNLVPDCVSVPMKLVSLRWIFTSNFQSVSYATAASTFGGIVNVARRMRLRDAMLVLRCLGRAVSSTEQFHRNARTTVRL